MTDNSTLPASRGSACDIEEGTAFAPKFDAAGLIACVVTDAASGELLMVAHMNAQALEQTVNTGEAWFYSRSRQKLWKKGETSDHVLRVVELRVDCDQDVLWLKAQPLGAGACHTGRRSCFYRAVVRSGLDARGAPPGPLTLEFREAGRSFDPAKVYGAPEPKKGDSRSASNRKLR